MPIDVLPGADEDLDRLESTDPRALAVILAVLEEAESVLETAATKYRVVYGYDWRSQRIGILAIVHREKDDFDYGTERDIEDRIFTDWRAATGNRDT